MQTNLKAGDALPGGFTVTEVVDLAELSAVGIYARHKSGLALFHLLNDDKENLFALAFATAARESTGIAHIMEHTVLCGSERYPLRDPFIVLAQGSLQTFLNAMTYPDKTIYPASTTNEHDYFNLFSVYGDAVFRPRLAELSFLQEGHRLEYDAQGRLSINGIVYNEMKGAYSALDEYAEHWVARSVMPDTPYAYDSGGDPECIPSLSWERFKAFHHERYTPANCRVFLAGNIPTEKQCEFLDREFLSSLEPGKAAEPVPLAERWVKPRHYLVPCPAGAERKGIVYLSWLLEGGEAGFDSLALEALEEVLLGHDGSPLAKALMESGLGEDCSSVSGLLDELREPLFVAGLRGVNLGVLPWLQAAKVEKVILDCFQHLAREGIPKADIEAALLALEFSNREIKRAGGPFSLVWLCRSLKFWLHGGAPWAGLVFEKPFAELKSRLSSDGRFFEKLIEKNFLDNRHRARVIVKPDKGFLAKQEKTLRRTLDAKEKSLSPAEREEIRRRSAELQEGQTRKETPAELAVIPHLSRSDLERKAERMPRVLRQARDIPVVSHPVFTNGISYVGLAMPVDVLTPEDRLYLPLFTRCVYSCGLPGIRYDDLSSLLARTTGDFGVNLHTSSPSPGVAIGSASTLGMAGRDMIIYQCRALDEKLQASLQLTLKIITQADFTDLRRLRDLLLEMKSDFDGSLAPHGSILASRRVGASFSSALTTGERWSGLSQLEFIHRAVTLDTAEVSRTLTRIRDTLASKAGLCVNYTGLPESALLGSLSALFKNFGAPAPRAGEAAGNEPLPARSEVFSSPSLQVGFAASALRAAVYATPESAAELVLAHYLSTGTLWERIRLKGGAYGARSYADNIERIFGLSSYRDPLPTTSLAVFADVLNEEAETTLDESILEKMIIGTYSKETQPRAPAQKGASDFLRYMAGVTDDARDEKLASIISCDAAGLSEAARRLARGISTAPRVVIAGNELAEKAAQALGVEVTALPV